MDGRKVRTGVMETGDGALLSYEMTGSGPPILLIHGWTMSRRFWRHQVEGLAGEFTVVTMDLRSHGDSSKILAGHTIPRYAQDVRELIEYIGLDDAVLMGWSLGGPVVLSYWQQFGGAGLRALGLVDMTPFPFSPAPWNCHRLRNHNVDGMHKAFAALEENRRAFGAEFVQGMFAGRRGSPEDVAWMLGEHLKTPAVAAVAIYSDYLMRDFTDVLPSITLPAAVFGGNSTNFPEGVQLAEYIGSQIPRATFFPFHDGGHVLFYEHPSKFNSCLAEFAKTAAGT